MKKYEFEIENQGVIDPLDKKTTDRINRLSAQQIIELGSKYIKSLTCDFDERYSRLILSKAANPSDQRELLNAITKSFDYCYFDFNGYYEREIPQYFEDWDNALAFGEIITSEQEAQPSTVPVQEAESIPQLLDEEGMLKHWMSMCMNQLSAAVNDANSRAQEITKEIKGMRDGSITRLLKRVEELETEKNVKDAKCKTLVEEVNRLQSWYDDWQHLRNKIECELYAGSDILEAGGLDDPSVMAEAINAIMGGYSLQKENEELRAKQEAWRESEEYKAERRKWESANQQRIDVKDIKTKLLKYAETFSPNESERLRSLVLNLNTILRATAWEQVSQDIEGEVMAIVFAKEKPVIRPEKMEVGTLNAEAVNDVHDNNNVNLGKDGGER